MRFLRHLHPAKTARFICLFVLSALLPSYAASGFAQTTYFSQTAYNEDTPNRFENIDVNFFADGRLRYQTVSQENFNDDAKGLTFRLKGGLEFILSDLFSTLIEIEASEVLTGGFNDMVNNENLPIIPDVDTLEINRLQFQSEIEGLRLTLGRQVLALDNWRFLGNWEFRQNDQTVDAFRLEASLGKGRVNVGFFNKVHRHFGNDSPVGEFTGDSFFANYSYPLPLGQISLFHYGLDLETGLETAPINTFSSVTSGVRLHGRRHWKDYGLAWDLSLARQSDFADNPNDYDAYYRDVSLDFTYKNIELSTALEVLGSDEGVSVQTPLGTLHNFQGVTDRFFQTPPDGLRDYSAGLKVDIGSLGAVEHIEFKAGYHKFTSDIDKRDYGRELNFGISTKINDVLFLFEYGDFKSQSLAVDNGPALFTQDSNVLIFAASYSFE